MSDIIDEKSDHLCLGANHGVRKMLKKLGDKNGEVVVFSDFVIKINRKEKEQTRVLMLTDKAVYNLMPNNYPKCKRRIPLKKIFSVTGSTASDEFVLHVPDEYDYRFKSSKKERICTLVVKLFKQLGETGHQCSVTYVNQADLKDCTVTKAMARLQTREEVLKRKNLLAAVEHESDKEETQVDSSKNEVTKMMEGQSDKVQLKDFTLLRVLGRGSFGKVMQVRMKSNGKIYAMKILKKRAIVKRNQVEHTIAERHILQALQHPFLMTLRYAFQSKEKLYFVLDYYTGGELFFHLKTQKRFPEKVAKIYVAEIALALGHLHSLNVIYRDLKPENILLDENGHVCLTDFGLSKDMEPESKAHTFCGTPEYLAPEIIKSKGHNKAVDWWSLGILLYELTVGIPPFYSQNINEMYEKIQGGVLRFPPFLSKECKQMIVELLNRNPQKRLGSSDEDVEELKKHPFFSDIDFKALLNKEVEVPYKPKVQGDDDTSNFDKAFTEEPVVDTMVKTGSLSSAGGDAFSGFTFNPNSDLGK